MLPYTHSLRGTIAHAICCIGGSITEQIGVVDTHKPQ